MVMSIAQEDGTQEKSIGMPIKFSKTPGKVKSPPTSFGKDTEEILMGLGFLKEEFDEII